jgi:hypothetical protein
MIKEGVETMLKMAIHILKKSGERQTPRLLMVDDKKKDDESPVMVAQKKVQEDDAEPAEKP